MKIQKTMGIAVVILALVLFVGCSDTESPTSVTNDDTSQIAEKDVIEYPLLQVGTEMGFTLYPGQTAAVTFQPWSTGTWDFSAWHTNMMLYGDCAGVSFYWRDALNPSDPWHWWTNDAAGYTPALSADEVFYSGSIGITYRVEFSQHTDYLMPIRVIVD